jgi:large subunit ribosomal protein L27
MRAMATLRGSAERSAFHAGDFVMAHKKGQGSTQNGRDSNPQFRGVKLFGGQEAKSGSIIMRQCGTRWKAGYLVKLCSDHTLMALADGVVRFRGRNVDIIPSDPATPRLAIDRA